MNTVAYFVIRFQLRALWNTTWWKIVFRREVRLQLLISHSRMLHQMTEDQSRSFSQHYPLHAAFCVAQPCTLFKTFSEFWESLWPEPAVLTWWEIIPCILSFSFSMLPSWQYQVLFHAKCVIWFPTAMCSSCSLWCGWRLLLFKPKMWLFYFCEMWFS